MRVIAFFGVLITCAVLSEMLLRRMRRSNKSTVLAALFLTGVLAPVSIIVAASVMNSRWPVIDESLLSQFSVLLSIAR